jgi:hypothetical protein
LPHVGPPQSTTVSAPSFFMFVHEPAATQTLIVGSHALVAQSLSFVHAFPRSHAAQAPPQSTSDSSKSFMPSVHVDCDGADDEEPDDELHAGTTAASARAIAEAESARRARTKERSMQPR